MRELPLIQQLFILGLALFVIYGVFAGGIAMRERGELCDALSDIQRALPVFERERLEMEFNEAYGLCE